MKDLKSIPKEQGVGEDQKPLVGWLIGSRTL